MEEHPAGRDPWLWMGALVALGFLVLAVVVSRQGGIAIDEPLAAAIQDLPIPPEVWEAITGLGGLILIPIGVAFTLSAVLTGRYRLALIVVIVLIGATLFTDLVKDTIARPRPTVNPLVEASGYSFPSGHSLNSAAVYGLIALVAWRSRLALTVRKMAVVLGITLPLLVGLSRVALGVHYPSDVLGGWLAGIAFVALGAVLIGLSGAMKADRPRWVAERGADQPDVLSPPPSSRAR